MSSLRISNLVTSHSDYGGLGILLEAVKGATAETSPLRLSDSTYLSSEGINGKSRKQPASLPPISTLLPLARPGGTPVSNSAASSLPSLTPNSEGITPSSTVTHFIDSRSFNDTAPTTYGDRTALAGQANQRLSHYSSTPSVAVSSSTSPYPLPSSHTLSPLDAAFSLQQLVMSDNPAIRGPSRSASSHPYDRTNHHLTPSTIIKYQQQANASAAFTRDPYHARSTGSILQYEGQPLGPYYDGVGYQQLVLSKFEGLGRGSAPSSVTSSTSSIVGPARQPRKRRKYDEIRRIFRCTHPGCNKSYGTLNHLNHHITLQKHGEKKKAADYKDSLLNKDMSESDDSGK